MNQNQETAAAGDMLAAALDYATSHGWCVLPLHDVTAGVCSCREREACKTPGKHPRISKWQLVASSNPDLIAGWWAGWPTANVGILTGRRSNLVVLDVDPRHGGDKKLQALIAEHEPLPTPSSPKPEEEAGITTSPAHPETGPSTARDRPGLELKADGTFVVAPPSRT